MRRIGKISSGTWEKQVQLCIFQWMEKDINFNSNVEGRRKVIEVAAWEEPTFKSWGKKDMLIRGWNIDHVKFYLSN